MDTFRERLGRDVLVLDGAMGTMLQQAGLLGSGAPEALNIIEPDAIARIHTFYALAGADCATTNTFGANRIKLAHYNNADLAEEINTAAVKLARRSGVPYVLADMGPTGLMTDFDEVYDVFFQQAQALAVGKPDAFLLETFTDIGELRCAVLACKDAAPELPIVASVSFGESGRMELSGTDPEAAAVILEAIGVDAIGLNCGLGPQQLEPLVQQMRAVSMLPIVVQPNAGMPAVDSNGATYFPGKPEDFSTFAQKMLTAGVAGIGSCCGSTPEFTAAIADEVFVLQQSQGAEYAQVIQVTQAAQMPDFGLRIASPQRALRIGDSATHHTSLRALLRTIGERINPTGKPALKTELQEGTMTLVRTFAAQQQAAGADILDINVGVAGIDEVATLKAAVLAVAGTFPLPIAIDTTSPEALEAALRAYPGKALVNSVTGEQRSLNAVLPLVARYGAAVVVLALDDEGIPDTAEGRLNIVRKVQIAARKHGIPDTDLLVDSLVMAAAADKDAPRATLETMRLIQDQLGLATVLGVSNVSHGLPNRALLNAAFLTAAAHYGLSAAIINPNEDVMAEAVKTINLTSHPDHSTDPLADFESLLEEALKPQHIPKQAAETNAENMQELPLSEQLVHAMVLGDSDGAPGLVDELIQEGMSPANLIESILTPAIQDLGSGFADGTVFLPQLMVAADAMKVAVDQAKTHLPATDPDADTTDSSRPVIFATVKGDIHSIGKDICVSLLESQGVTVHNLGVDVPTQQILDAAAHASAVCLSALMTTTLPAMLESTQALHKAYPNLPVLLGGAVVTREWADSQDAYYEEDAPSLAARIVELLQDSNSSKRQ